MNPLRIHFVNVGRGDCTIVEHPQSGHVTVVDINNSFSLMDEEISDSKAFIERNYADDILIESIISQIPREEAITKVASSHIKQIAEAYDIELEDPVDYLMNVVRKREIFRFILTHPDCDHLTGLARLQQEMDAKRLTVSNFWHIPTVKTVKDFKSEEEKSSWQTYQAWKSKDFSRSYLKDYQRQYFNLGADGHGPGDGIYILSPDQEILDDAHKRYEKKSDIYNNASYILLFQHGNASVILGGDAFGCEGSTSPSNEPQDDCTPNAWQHLINTTKHEVIQNISLLKASHHGLESGFHPDAVSLMNPALTIVSEGSKKDQDAQHRYPNETLSTRFYGTIVADVYESGEVVVWTKRNRKDHGSLLLTNNLGFYYNEKSQLFNNSPLHMEFLARYNAVLMQTSRYR